MTYMDGTGATVEIKRLTTPQPPPLQHLRDGVCNDVPVAEDQSGPAPVSPWRNPRFGPPRSSWHCAPIAQQRRHSARTRPRRESWPQWPCSSYHACPFPAKDAWVLHHRHKSSPIQRSVSVRRCGHSTVLSSLLLHLCCDRKE